MDDFIELACGCRVVNASGIRFPYIMRCAKHYPTTINTFDSMSHDTRVLMNNCAIRLKKNYDEITLGDLNKYIVNRRKELGEKNGV